VPQDPRIEQYARILVEDCVDVQPGWQVAVRSQPLARPLIEEVCRQIARRGAYALTRLGFSATGIDAAWVNEAPEELLAEVPDVERYGIEKIDCFIAIIAPENTREGVDIAPERAGMIQAAYRPLTTPFFSGEKPWVGCQYPTPALAQDAGMTLEQFEEFLYGAVLIDWDAEHARMTGIKELFDGAGEVRITGAGTDLRLSLRGRSGMVDAGGANMPGGEVFFSPVEDSAEGTIEFSEFPGVYAGREVTGIRFRFVAGEVVEASATSNEEFLLQTLDTDPGARRLGELGIGCNPGITRHMKNAAFDEKIDGTVHLAVGKGFPELGGTNESVVHWDIVKDLRQDGSLEVDGRAVQTCGEWLT
jgi:aminopeptidase